MKLPTGNIPGSACAQKDLKNIHANENVKKLDMQKGSLAKGLEIKKQMNLGMQNGMNLGMQKGPVGPA